VPTKIREAKAKVESLGKERYPRVIPVIKLNLKYKPMEVVTKAPHFFKYVPTVFTDGPNFDYNHHDYELNSRDKQFLKEINDKLVAGGGSLVGTGQSQVSNQEPLTEKEFERFIDVMDKIYQITKNKQDAVILRHWFDVADPALVKKASQPFLTAHLFPYWKKGKRWTRKFWENPDMNDPDVTAAFRKRNDQNQKMQLRRNEFALKQKLQRKRQMKEETVKYVVTKLLPSTWKREATKQALDRIHDE